MISIAYKFSLRKNFHLRSDMYILHIDILSNIQKQMFVVVVL